MQMTLLHGLRLQNSNLVALYKVAFILPPVNCQSSDKVDVFYFQIFFNFFMLETYV